MHCNQRFYFIIILLNEYKLIVVLTASRKYQEGRQTLKFFHNFINELKMKKENLEDQNDVLYWRM